MGFSKKKKKHGVNHLPTHLSPHLFFFLIHSNSSPNFVTLQFRDGLGLVRKTQKMKEKWISLSFFKNKGWEVIFGFLSTHPHAFHNTQSTDCHFLAQLGLL
jgi:hypothetical protein